MSAAGLDFKRMVVGLLHSMASQAAVDAAADLAESLNIELLAAFIADATLPALAELSGAREIGMLGLGWRAIDRIQVGQEVEQAVDAARRRFAEGIKSRTVKAKFDILTGAEAIASLVRADDIVAIIEPAHPAERITWQFTALLKAAFATAGAVLIVPRKIVRTAGPIVALAFTADDPTVALALQLAAAFKERLIVVTGPGLRLSLAVLADAERRGVEIEHFAYSGSLVNTPELAALPRFGERLRVLPDRVLADGEKRLLSFLHETPLLVVEHRREPLPKQ